MASDARILLNLVAAGFAFLAAALGHHQAGIARPAHAERGQVQPHSLAWV